LEHRTFDISNLSYLILSCHHHHPSRLIFAQAALFDNYFTIGAVLCADLFTSFSDISGLGLGRYLSPWEF
jgi:hypothetical protein